MYCLYVLMYVCMYIYIYICINVCVHVCIYVCHYHSHNKCNDSKLSSQYQLLISVPLREELKLIHRDTHIVCVFVHYAFENYDSKVISTGKIRRCPSPRVVDIIILSNLLQSEFPNQISRQFADSDNVFARLALMLLCQLL